MSKQRSKVDDKLSNFKEAVKLASLDNSVVDEKVNRSPFHAKHHLHHTPTPIEKLNEVIQNSNNKRTVTPTGTSS
jgi:hypothetical protein